MLLSRYRILIPFLFLIFLTACGDSDSSSENSSTDSIVSDAGTITVSQRTVETGSAFTLNYSLGSTASKQTRAKDLVGTVHWGDNTTDRISGEGQIQHTYTTAGTFSINIQVDSGTLIRLGDITVTTPNEILDRSRVFTAPSGGTSFVVPAGITSISVTAKGASGQDTSRSTGGQGGSSAVTINVTAGETLTLIVGGIDGTGGGGNIGSGGSAGNGGGRSAVERAGTPLIVAGGGGGGGSNSLQSCNGGNGGGASGSNGGNSNGNQGGFGGSGGTGGNGGVNSISSTVSRNGADGTATDGGRGGNSSNGGGGGGGGYGGGGGGASGQGVGGACGGGGGFALSGTTTAGGNVGNGSLVLVLQ
jgi:hypothetical protein